VQTSFPGRQVDIYLFSLLFVLLLFVFFDIWLMTAFFSLFPMNIF